MDQKTREKRLLNLYLLTLEDWESISRFQNNVCFICGNPSRSNKSLSTDHAHTSGIIRGLLCDQCNRFLGKIENSWVLAGRPLKSLLECLLRLYEYLSNPPAVRALNREIFTYPGRFYTKKHRKYLKAKKKSVTPLKHNLKEAK